VIFTASLANLDDIATTFMFVNWTEGNASTFSSIFIQSQSVMSAVNQSQ